MRAIAPGRLPLGSTSQRGLLELANTGEIDTGTDTARVVTAAQMRRVIDDLIGGAPSDRNTLRELSDAINTRAPTHSHPYASSGHGHSQYATDSELSSGLAGKSNTGHGHTGFAASSHSHGVTDLPASAFDDGRVTGISVSGTFTSPGGGSRSLNSVTVSISTNHGSYSSSVS